jgi:hypothetical protein
VHLLHVAEAVAVEKQCISNKRMECALRMGLRSPSRNATSSRTPRSLGS